MTLDFQSITKAKKEGAKKPWQRSSPNAATAVVVLMIGKVYLVRKRFFQ